MSIICKKKYTDCELLSPAGSFKCMQAAFNAGADAVYLGGDMFGARAYADNFNTEELIRAIDYAHLREKKIYLTVNTLLKTSELEDMLIPYIMPLYEAGLDAVIVQDMGVLMKIRQEMPDLDVHASTQMNVTGVYFAQELKELGVTRIVTARELSLAEIKSIYDATGLEIESFVHGALCYSYSGQCLFSSIIGGRSGNRGRCGQPCRLPYSLYDDKGQIKNDTWRYLLSPKDLCTLSILPDILEAGVYSLKIEGRMKKPEYVAGAVSAYRKQIDILKASDGTDIKANWANEALKEDLSSLKDLYNRGGFTDGYYKRQNGREMMSLYKPNHYGLKVGKILSVTAGNITFKALNDIDENDVIEVNLKKPQTPTELKHGSIRAGSVVNVRNSISGLTNFDMLYEDGIFRTRNNKLIADIEENIVNRTDDVALIGKCSIRAGEKIRLSAVILGSDIETVCFGAIPEAASNKPATAADIEAKLKKTGATDFYFKRLDIELDDGLFVPVSELNRLRRQCLDDLRQKALRVFKRCRINEVDNNMSCVSCDSSYNLNMENILMECVVSDKAQLLGVLGRDFTDVIGLELSSFSYEEMKKYIYLIAKKNKKPYIALPFICRERAINEFNKNIDFFDGIINDISGFIVRNYEEYIFFSHFCSERSIKKNFILDTNVYMFNEKSLEYAAELSKKHKNPITPTIPYELNQNEIKAFRINGLRMEIYGYIPVMTTAGCIKKTIGMCGSAKDADKRLRLKDRKNNYMYVSANCRYCYNSIYNSVPLYLGGEIEELIKMNIHHFSMRFTMENEKETNDILDKLEAALSGGKSGITDFTRGHFRRGVM